MQALSLCFVKYLLVVSFPFALADYDIDDADTNTVQYFPPDPSAWTHITDNNMYNHTV